MSSIDKTSVRDQVNQLKADFHRLSASEKLSLETKTLVLGLLTLVEIMLAVFMEKKTPKMLRVITICIVTKKVVL